MQARLGRSQLLWGTEVTRHIYGARQVPQGPGGLALGLHEASHHLPKDDILAEAGPGGKGVSALGAVVSLPKGTLVVPEALKASHAEVMATGCGDWVAEHLQANGTENLFFQYVLTAVAALQELGLGFGGLGRELRGELVLG